MSFMKFGTGNVMLFLWPYMKLNSRLHVQPRDIPKVQLVLQVTECYYLQSCCHFEIVISFNERNH